MVSPLGSVDPSIIPDYIPPTDKMDGGFRAPYASSSMTNRLPTVDNPDEVYADLTRQDYLDYKNDYGDFESQLIQDARTDTSLIDQARDDAAGASRLAEGVASRNASRYGAALTPAQLKEQGRSLQRGNTLGTSQALNNARIAQKELNTQKVADLVNIGQGVNRTSLSQLQGAAADAANRKSAYDNAKAQSKAQTYGTLGALGSAAIFALAF